MALDTRLDHVILPLPCTECGHVLEKTGSWYKTVNRFRCLECKLVNPLPYPKKEKLFADHTHLAV